MIIRTHEYEATLDDAETRQVLAEAARSFVSTVEFYKGDLGGANSHEEAVKEALKCHEWRRGYVEGLSVEEINWGHLAAVLRLTQTMASSCGHVCARLRTMNCNPVNVEQRLQATIPRLIR